MDKVYLLTYGSGDDGDEWGVVSIHMSRETAEAEREKDGWGVNVSGDKYSYDWGITEWDVVGVKSLDDKGYESADDEGSRGENVGVETIPCPFCGDKAEFTYDSVVDDEVKNKCNRILSSIGCWNPDCPIQPSLTGIEDEEEAIAIWNKRWGGFRDE